MRMRAVSLPDEVTALLEKNVDVIKMMRQTTGVRLDVSQSSTEAPRLVESAISTAMRNKVALFRNQLDQAFRNARWGDAVDSSRILSFGPRSYGPNLLVNQSSMHLPGPWHDSAASNDSRMLENLSSFINGFQLATLAGPLCDEPLMGVCFIVEELSILDPSTTDGQQYQQQLGGPLSGQIMSTVKEGCRRAFQAQPQRLMAAMYNCFIQVSGEVVGESQIIILSFLLLLLFQNWGNK